jgi:hypothetical protein
MQKVGLNSAWRLLYMCILFSSLLVSCAKTESEETQEPPPPPTPRDSTVTKPVESGIVIGTVVLYNLDKRVYPTGMKITLYNNKDTIRHTITGMTEFFQLEKVPLGIYTIRYEQDSVGTSYVFGAKVNLANQVNFLPEMNLGYKSLGTLSYFGIDTTEAYRGNWFFRQVRNPKARMIYESTVRYFFSISRDLSHNRFDTSWALTYGNLNVDTLESSLTYDVFERLGFSSGEKIFVKAYSDGYYSNAYYDPVLKHVVYPNISLGSPAIDSFVLRK